MEFLIEIVPTSRVEILLMTCQVKGEIAAPEKAWLAMTDKVIVER